MVNSRQHARRLVIRLRFLRPGDVLASEIQSVKGIGVVDCLARQHVGGVSHDFAGLSDKRVVGNIEAFQRVSGRYQAFSEGWKSVV